MKNEGIFFRSIVFIGPAKRVKREPGVRASKVQEIEELKKKLAEAQEEMESMPVAKLEPAEEDDAFRMVVDSFATETQQCPMQIDDSD